MHPTALPPIHRTASCFRGMPDRARLLVFCGMLFAATPGARAADWLDTLFGKAGASEAVGKPGARQRVWKLHDFTTIALVPAEAGAAPSAHGALLNVDALRQSLAAVRVADSTSALAQPLFAADELAELVKPLAEAFERAGPQDDVLLLSASRRERGVLAAPTAITARLFVLGEALQVVVHDARFDFYDTFRATNSAPRFVFGSRTLPASVGLRHAEATQVRSDWLSIPLANVTGMPSGASVSGPGAPKATAQPMPRVVEPAGAEDAERRLKNLKRLRELNLITEEEHQKKRLEILQLL